MARLYHHGNLRQAVLDRAVETIAEKGPTGFSLRSLATDIGVSHTAPRHHFGNRRGVLTAVAAQGFSTLAERLVEVRRADKGFLEAGVTYVQFAVDFPAHFEVMFMPDLLDSTDPELAEAKAAAFAELQGGVDQMSQAGRIEDAAAAVVAGWGIAHGIATLELTGNLESAGLRDLISNGDIAEITRRSAGMLYGSPPRSDP